MPLCERNWSMDHFHARSSRQTIDHSVPLETSNRNNCLGEGTECQTRTSMNLFPTTVLYSDNLRHRPPRSTTPRLRRFPSIRRTWKREIYSREKERYPKRNIAQLYSLNTERMLSPHPPPGRQNKWSRGIDDRERPNTVRPGAILATRLALCH